jgi:MYXO-CTERM domain-containing protein
MGISMVSMLSTRTLRIRPIVIASASALFSAGFAALPATARADTQCASDSDCTKGFTCQTSGITGCAEPACAPVAVDGGPSEACDAATTCTPQTIQTCQPAPCTADSDCAAGMVCHAETYATCEVSVSPPCAKGDECAASLPPTCTTTTVDKVCIPKYDLPCTVDADCGDHFTCTPNVSTECWGSASGGGASSSAADAGASPVVEPSADASPPSSGCTTTKLGTSSCVAQTIACTTAADCPSTWSCQSAPTPAIYNCPAQIVGSDAGGCDVDAQVQASQSTCVPPNYATSGSGTSNGGGTLSASSGSAAGDAGAVAPVSATEGTGAVAGNGGGGGCQMASSQAGGWSGAWLALLGALGFVARRRRHAAVER